MSNLMHLVATAAQHLINIVAGTADSIHALEASNPLIGQAINLAMTEGATVPQIAALESIGQAVLSFAQTMAHASAASVTAPAPATSSTN